MWFNLLCANHWLPHRHMFRFNLNSSAGLWKKKKIALWFYSLKKKHGNKYFACFFKVWTEMTGWACQCSEGDLCLYRHIKFRIKHLHWKGLSFPLWWCVACLWLIILPFAAKYGKAKIFWSSALYEGLVVFKKSQSIVTGWCSPTCPDERLQFQHCVFQSQKNRRSLAAFPAPGSACRNTRKKKKHS